MSWQSIECIDQNGIITGYDVDFQQTDGTATTAGEIVGQTFTARGLRPFTDFTFRVAGVSNEGRGPFTDTITVRTNGDSMLAIHCFVQVD